LASPAANHSATPACKHFPGRTAAASNHRNGIGPARNDSPSFGFGGRGIRPRRNLPCNGAAVSVAMDLLRKAVWHSTTSIGCPPFGHRSARWYRSSSLQQHGERHHGVEHRGFVTFSAR
jgi:hypothetical protein